MKSKSISSTKSSSKKKAQAPAPIPILLDDDETGESELECGGRNSPPLPATAEPAQSDSEPELVGAVFNSISLPSSTRGDEIFYNLPDPSTTSDTILPLRTSSDPEDHRFCLQVSLYNGVPVHLRPLIRNHTSFRNTFEPSIREGRKHWIDTLRQCIGTIYFPSEDISSASAREKSTLINQLLKWDLDDTDPPTTPPFACPSGQEDGNDIFRERRLALCGLALLKGPATAKRVAKGIRTRKDSLFVSLFSTIDKVGTKSEIEYEELYHYHRDLLLQGRDSPAIRATLAFWNSIIFADQVPADTQTTPGLTTQATRRLKLTDRLAKLKLADSGSQLDTVDLGQESMHADDPTQAATGPTAHISAGNHANPPTTVTTITAPPPCKQPP
ncbi:hypothetical protein BD779DRAFT_1681807 [Infundibulicybe gibba]|nr:hypothetical protein BD779DRAFT_1681807 [Infundibulicybe gibba]